MFAVIPFTSGARTEEEEEEEKKEAMPLAAPTIAN